MPLGIVLLRSSSNFPLLHLRPIAVSASFFSSLLLLCLLCRPLMVGSSMSPPITSSAPLHSFSPHELELIKRNFLSRLGLQRVPAPASPSIHVPDHMWALYEKMQTAELQSDWIRHYYPKDRRLLASIGPDYNVHDRDWIDIDVSEAVRNLQQDQMTLLVTMSVGTTLSPSPSHSLSSLPYSRIHSAPLILFCETQEKIAKTRRKREATPNANEASTSRSGTGTETAQGGDRTNPEGSRKGKKQRKHQNRASHTGSQSDNLCSRRSLYVDFEELNWQDWIMAPKGYEAGECSGQCIHPLPDHLNATNHAIIQSLIHSFNPSQVPPPCCIPTQTAPLSILYMDVDNV
ncbi:hypothetical protein WR25_11614 [Diploscapter pachys]|uniref:TGF-beta family profile domain-containing protein n=1 Tax=Diploscapter pachys TaxID=2018661 RepID=A0A2A2KRF0_9BILA|nr:hypothetical protein WR25_11614 [Diploscapter pachys]